MKTKLFILLFATILGAVITGCNHQPEESNGGSTNTPSMSDTNLAATNSMGSVNVPSVGAAVATASNNMMTNHP